MWHLPNWTKPDAEKYAERIDQESELTKRAMKTRRKVK
jgi:hypothetical protein